MGFQRSCLVAAGAILLATTGLVNQGLARPPFPPPPIFIPPPPGVVIGVPAPPSVHVRVSGPPPIVFPAPPQLVMIPDSDVYYAPDVEEEIVFSQGYWWRPYDGRWYRSRSHGGPWRHVVRSRVPHPIIGLPPGYRHHYHDGPRFHHREVERRWRGGPPHGGPYPGPHGGPRYAPHPQPRIEPR